MGNSQQFQIQLAWLNSTGGWEFWNFLARKTHGFNIGRVETVETDIFQNFDTDFIAGQTEQEVLQVKANERIVVRSQILTTQQINAIARIRLSIRVRDVVLDRTVIVDQSSFDYRTDSQKVPFIEFAISYPSEQIQSL